MSSSQSLLEDDGCRNWIKSFFSLLYLKQGIEVIIDTEAKVFHKILQKACGSEGPQACSPFCASDPVITGTYHEEWCMKFQLNNKWRPEIAKYLLYDPLLEQILQNTDPLLWPAKPYEVLKCYMPKGCKADQSVKEGDVQNLLRLIQNCSHFRKCKRISVESKILIDQVLEIRNSLSHSGNCHVGDTDLKKHLDTILEFLEKTLLVTTLSVPEKTPVTGAITKIKELKDHELNLSLDKEDIIAIQQMHTAVVKNLEALQDSDEKTREEFQKVKDMIEKLLKDLAKIEKDIQHQQEKTKALENLTQAQDSKLRDNDSKLEAQDSILQVHEDRLGQLQINQEAQDSKLRDHDRKQEAQDSKLQDHEDGLGQMKKNQEAQDSKLQDHEDRLGQMKKNQEVQTNELTDEDISNLRASLIVQYRATALQVRFPVGQEDVGLDRVYVDPYIKVLREKNNRNDCLMKVKDKPVPANVSQCCRLFYTDDYRCKEIYICGDAGTGKSTFCKHLVNTWCKAHNKESDPEDSDSEDYGGAIDPEDSDSGWYQQISSKTKRQSDKDKDRKIMSEFELLFYIKLRDSSNMYPIADMIDSQILQNDVKTKHFKADVLLQKFCCLVIVDGLDEWVCPENVKVSGNVNPGIPGRNPLDKTTYLTTTRPWKFNVLEFRSSQVDKHAELAGFKRSSSKRLCSKNIKVLNKSENKQRRNEEFWAELKNKNLAHLTTVPIILTQLVWLWFDDQNLGQSQVQLYCNLLEMLLKRPDKATQLCTDAKITETTEPALLECFSNHIYCRAHQQLLLSLSKLAFEALFHKDGENALSFESNKMEIYGLDEKSIALCLEFGILSQSKVLGLMAMQKKKISFLHKNLQEFLAALYIVICKNAEIVARVETFHALADNEEKVKQRVEKYCTSAEKTLEMSQVWMFVSGISPAMCKQLLTKLLYDFVFDDIRLQEYRQTITDVWLGHAFQRSIQTCIEDCVEEARSNNHSDFCLPLHDFFMDSDTIDDLFTSNLKSVKSVSLNTGFGSGQAEGDILEQLQNIRLKKLVLYGFKFYRANMLGEILTANKHHLTCLQLRNVSLTEMPADVWGVVKNLMALDLYQIGLTHEQLIQLLFFVSKATAMQQLQLESVDCMNHSFDNCTIVLNLSACKQLQTLDLSRMNIAVLAAVENCVKEFNLYSVTIPGGQLVPFLHKLCSVSHTVTVRLQAVTVTGDPEFRRTDNMTVKHWDYDGGEFIEMIEFQIRWFTISDISTPSV